MRKDEAEPGLELVVLVGLPGSGKSTFFRALFAHTHAHVSKDLFPHNRDKARRQRHLIQEALSAGRSVVVDNTNVRRADRSALIEQARTFGARVVCFLLVAEVSECLRRNEGRTGRAKVPAVAIHTAKKHLELPTLDEGFDALFWVHVDEAGRGFELRQVG